MGWSGGGGGGWGASCTCACDEQSNQLQQNIQTEHLPNANLEDAVEQLWGECDEFANGDDQLLLQNSLSQVVRTTPLVQDRLEFAGSDWFVQHLLFVPKHPNCDL